MSIFYSIKSANLSIHFYLKAAGSFLQGPSSNAFLAHSTARLTSSAVAYYIEAIFCSVAGLIVSNVLPSDEFTHSLLINN